MTKDELLALADDKDKAADAVSTLVGDTKVPFADRKKLFEYATELRAEVFALRNEAAKLQGKELGVAAASLAKAVREARTTLETIRNVKSAIELTADLLAITWYLVDGKLGMVRAAAKELRKDLKEAARRESEGS